ncbi:hypothetical protein V2O64_24195 (plasmid) [Verrucomicrobiaceae bacterium 227]
MRSTLTFIFAFLTVVVGAHAGEKAPPVNILKHGSWARETKDLPTRIQRLENFLKDYLPIEEGGVIATEFEDGSSALAVTGAAWVLARSYIEAGEKTKALKMLDWLQQHDSRSMLCPIKEESEQVKDVAGQAAGRSGSK